MKHEREGREIDKSCKYRGAECIMKDGFLFARTRETSDGLISETTFDAEFRVIHFKATTKVLRGDWKISFNAGVFDRNGFLKSSDRNDVSFPKKKRCGRQSALSQRPRININFQGDFLISQMDVGCSFQFVSADSKGLEQENTSTRHCTSREKS